MYASGRGVREDYREALTWYRSYMLWPLDRVGVGVDAKKGNHGPRRMGDHGSIGNGANRARAASTEAPTAHPNGRYQEAFGCGLPAWDRRPASRAGKVQVVPRS